MKQAEGWRRVASSPCFACSTPNHGLAAHTSVRDQSHDSPVVMTEAARSGSGVSRREWPQYIRLTALALIRLSIRPSAITQTGLNSLIEHESVFQQGLLVRLGGLRLSPSTAAFSQICTFTMSVLSNP